MATISTHNGSTLSQGHNRREKKITDKEEHIKKDGVHETWKDIDIKKAYSVIFDESVAEYNEKQKRKDRQIKDYYEKIEKDKKKKVAYEMIVGVYGTDTTDKQKKEILKEFAQGWKDRNPNLIMVGCYYHADEEGQPHIHIDYIPTYVSAKGMKVQNGLNKALEQQGIQGGTSIHETPQIMWQKRENAYLELLCNERGIKVQRSKETRQHESTQTYKLKQSVKEVAQVRQENRTFKEALENLGKDYEEAYQEYENLLTDYNTLVDEYNDLRRNNNRLSSRFDEVSEELRTVGNFFEEKELSQDYLDYKEEQENQRENSNRFELDDL